MKITDCCSIAVYLIPCYLVFSFPQPLGICKNHLMKFEFFEEEKSLLGCVDKGVVLVVRLL